MNENSKKTVNHTMPAIAELNRVEGFNPEHYAREISDEGQDKRLYLDVKWRILWFRLKYPNGKITTNATKLADNYAVVEARVYCDKNDTAENYISKGMAQRSLDLSNPRFGNRFIESAETAAIGRALAMGGFGLQFCCDINGEDDTDIADAPIESSFVREQADNTKAMEIQTSVQPDIVFIENTSSSDDEEPNLPLDTEPQTKQVNPEKLTAPVGLLVNTAKKNETAQNPVKSVDTMQQDQNQQATPKYTKSTSVDDIYKVMTLDEAKSCVIDVGIFQGKTLGQLAKEKPDRVSWYIDSYSGPNNILKAAAKILVEIATNEQLAMAS